MDRPKMPTLVPLVMGVSHHCAPIEVRELLGAAKLADTGLTPPGVLLATCNRVEVHAVAHTAHEGLQRLRFYFAALWGQPIEELSPYLETHTGEDAVRHLFRVASGLDSLVVGESEVLGQVGSALRAAVEAGAVGRESVRLFHHAVRVGRRVRVETGISRHAGSVSSVAVALARRTIGDLSRRRVLVIGAGEAGKLSTRALVDAGAGEVLVANRTPDHAARVAEEIGGMAVPWSGLVDALARADVVVTATNAPGHILTAHDVQEALQRHPTGRIVILDIAVPRNVEPQAADVAGVTLHNVDGLQAAVDAGLGQRRAEVAKVEDIIAEELDRFRTWWRAIDVLPTIRDLYNTAEDLRQRELEKALRMLPDLSNEERAVVEALSRSLVRKLLHDPVVSLKDGAGDPLHVAATRRLFHLTPEGAHEPD